MKKIPDAEINCNGMRYVFLDTMIWIEMLKSAALSSQINSWLNQNKYIPIIHSNLLMELFQSSNQSDFDQRWEIVSQFGFSNISPMRIIFEEINFMYLNGKIEKSKMLHDAVYILSDDKKAIWKNEYFKNANLLQKQKKESAKKELLTKSLEQNADIKADDLVGDLLKRMRRSEYDKKYSLMQKRIPELMKASLNKRDNHKYELLSEIDSYSALYINNGIGAVIDSISKLIKHGYCTYDEIAKYKYSEISDHLGYFDVLMMAFRKMKYSPDQWEDYIDEMRCVLPCTFPGYSLYKDVSNRIRLSNAKSKSSDPIDFINVTFVPYCDKYVTDAHIAEEVKKCRSGLDSVVISVQQFKKIIAS